MWRLTVLGLSQRLSSLCSRWRLTALCFNHQWPGTWLFLQFPASVSRCSSTSSRHCVCLCHSSQMVLKCWDSDSVPALSPGCKQDLICFLMPSIFGLDSSHVTCFPVSFLQPSLFLLSPLFLLSSAPRAALPGTLQLLSCCCCWCGHVRRIDAAAFNYSSRGSGAPFWHL